ncbi:MAG: hypothetical protein J0L63_18590 [Anaerolineae bacterium]|nr:hypothetical protein [Anaerolineae bacterium]
MILSAFSFRAIKEIWGFAAAAAAAVLKNGRESGGVSAEGLFVVVVVVADKEHGTPSYPGSRTRRCTLKHQGRKNTGGRRRQAQNLTR